MILSALGLIGPLSLLLALLVIALLSQRLGMITKRTRYYRWFFVAIGLMLIALATQLETANGLVYSLLMAVALTIGAAIAWHYWGWLLHERQYYGLDVIADTATERKPVR